MASIRDFSVRWVLLPSLYAAATVPMLVASVFLGGHVAWAFFCQWVCGTGGLLALPLFGTPIFALLSFGLTRVERLRSFALLDHLRHCVVIYAFLALLAPILASGYGLPRWSLGWGLGVGLSLVSAYAVLVDAAVVYVMRRRSAQVGSHRP